VILLSDIAVRKSRMNTFSVVTPGYTSILTSREGVACLVLADGSNNIADARRRILTYLRLDEHAISGFLRDALRLGLLYRARDYRRHVFSCDDVIRNLVRPSFRSISEINLCPSTTCNLRCSYCRLWRGEQSLSFGVMRRLLSDARHLGANILNILGGEPTLYAQLTARIIRHAAQTGYERITVSTNGVRLTKTTARLWQRNGLQTLQVSVDRLLGAGKSLASAEAAVRVACAAFPEVIVSYVYYGQDSDIELPSMLERLQDYGVLVDLKVVIPMAGESTPVTPGQIAAFSRLARKLARQHDFVIPPEFSNTRRVFCGAGICHAFIEADGAVKPCGFLPDVAGNINKDSFHSIWLNSSWRKFFRPSMIRKHRCLECRLRPYCISGCPARRASKEFMCPESSRHRPIHLTSPRAPCIMSKVR